MWFSSLIRSLFERHHQSSPEEIAAKFESLVRQHGLQGRLWLRQTPFGTRLWWDVVPLVYRRGATPEQVPKEFMQALRKLGKQHEAALNAAGGMLEVIVRIGDPMMWEEVILQMARIPEQFRSRRGVIPVVPFEAAAEAQ